MVVGVQLRGPLIAVAEVAGNLPKRGAVLGHPGAGGMAQSVRRHVGEAGGAAALTPSMTASTCALKSGSRAMRERQVE